MNYFLEIAFSGFWQFVGCWILLCTAATIPLAIINRVLRHWTLIKHGYPPPHCNADGE